MPSPIAWQPMKQTGNVPTGRSGHTIVTFGKVHYMFGGIDSPKDNPDKSKILPKNELYTLRITNTPSTPNTAEWSLKPCTGDIPLPRAYHAACKIGEDRMLIFGGYYTSSTRFNDTFYLKIANLQWSQPPNQKSVGEPKNSWSKIGAPQPRANHTATYHKGKVYVFGGHGGVDYKRVAFNDIYELDVENQFKWQKIAANGTPPEPRGGHVASILANKDKLLVFGGWNFSTQFHNIFIFNIETKTWEDPEVNHQIPKWNLGGIMAPSIPSYKYFIFGGTVGNFFEGSNRTSTKFVDDTWYLDADKLTWVPVPLEDKTKPKARESPACFYSQDDQRLYIFGGWANNWLNDMWVLPVGAITGPPYAIFDIKPALGPVTGKTKIIINGAGFKQSYGSITVRFTGGKGQIDANGIFKSENMIQCETPSFEQYGSRKVQVRLAFGKLDFTITKAQFTYFLNTKADQTIAFGPGLLHDNAVGVETMFIIQSRNADGKNRQSGSDEFIISIRRPDLQLPAEQPLDPKKQKQFDELPEEEKQAIITKKAEAQKERLRRVQLDYKIIDNEDGSYIVKYKSDEECKVIIQIFFKNEKGEAEKIRGHKFEASFSSKANPKANDFIGPNHMAYLTGNLSELSKFMQTSRDNIEIRTKNLNENIKQLLKVMTSLKDIDQRKQQYALTLDRIEQILKTLQKKYDTKKDVQLKKCQKLNEDLKTLAQMAQRVDRQIINAKTNESDKTKSSIIKFEDKLKDFNSQLKKEAFYQYDTGVQGSFAKIEETNQKIAEFKKTLADYMYYQQMFKFDKNQTAGAQKMLQIIENQVSWMHKLWVHIQKCEAKFNQYKNLKWNTINSGDIQDQIKKLRNGLQPIKISDRKCSSFVGISSLIKNWGVFIPMVSDLKDQSMDVTDDRHWRKVKVTVNKDFAINDALELTEIWNLKLFDMKDGIQEITDQAKNEAKMQKSLKKIIEFWKTIDFELVQHKNSTVKTLKMLDQHFQTLQEHQLNINTMLLSKYVAYFEKEVEKWKSDLGNIYDVVQLLNQVQKTWSFLQNLFIQSQQVKKQLPKESEQFVGIDRDMKQTMNSGCEIKNILKFCTIPGMLKRLQKIQADLKVCEKALNQFLDSKRRAFPRFYFVSVSDLLDILSNGNNPVKINRHMSKIFQAIQKLELQQSGERPTATGIKSGVGVQFVKLTKPLKLLGKVEIYLQDMINSMVSTLRDIAQSSFKAYQTQTRANWLKRDPAQITLLVNNVIWSSVVEGCFKKITDGTNVNAMKQFYKKSVQLLTDLIKMVQGDLDKPMRQKIMCLITMDTHSRDVIQKLDVQNVKKIDAFQWQSQLKFYWQKHGDIEDAIIKIADASFWYSYEYLGNGPRLVVTPLTDRIYVTATQALHLKMGCAPAGPAGTGKTQTTKDLANAVAKACYVFNCSSQMNYESMGNIYKGLASSGCWGCFDQFNRLLPEVLSVCSVQFKSVTDAIKENKKRFVLQGDQISLDQTCGVFITMNPGYLGRAELPQGLKALFRPITVVVPDLELICENMLMAEGFVEAKVLAKKFVTLYMLCRDLLSKQLHYDWGLRAIKSVLVVAGGFKRNQPTIAQPALLMRALRDFNLPKIAFADLDVFAGLLGDLFPGINIPRKRDYDFEKIVQVAAVQNGLFPEPEFILKVVQLSELLQIRHCVFVMGPPGSGKTSTWKMLGKAQDKAGKKTMIVDINPKTVSTRDLYGYNLPSKEWKDGLLSKMMRSLSEMADTNPKWILLDGDLDTNWIQSMNSVMDDNKILTLANNERIPLKLHMRMIFEIRDLRFASPATVSRAGILYISDDSGYQWQSYVKSWINRMLKSGDISEQLKGDLEKLFDKYVKGTLFYIKKSVKLLINVTPISMIISLCKILANLLKDGYTNLEYAFVFSLVWSCGGCLAEKDGFDYRKEFSNWWKSEWKTAVKFPSKGTIFDYYVQNPKPDSKEPCKFEEWTKTLVTVEFDASKGDIMGNITVPTKETIATEFFIKKYIQVAHPVLMIGLAGCGKTQLAKGILRAIVREKPENFSYQQINFNYYTDASYLQIQLQQFLQKKAGKQFGPPGKIRLIYFIDDLNMPQLDQYDTQSAISLLRQHADYQHWYDVSKLALKDIINTQPLAALNPSAGSFFVDPRYMRHFWTVSIPFPDNESLFLIYSTFLMGHLRKFKPALQQIAPLIIRSALSLHQTVISSFRKTAINFHYEFNLRHLSNIFQGLLLSDSSKYTEPEKFVKLWIHESQRTYGDRLVSHQHLAKYNSAMFELLKKSFSRFSLSKYFSNTPENLIFCNFTQGMNAAERLYDLMPNEKLFTHIEEGLNSYNDNNPVMNLVLFEDAMKHVCRITRIIMPSSGHALLVGVGGSGKQSLSRLAAFMMFMTTFQITISSTYNMSDLKNDLQLLYSRTGVKEQGYLFLFTQGQITNERFLVYINDLLSSGQIAQLYTSDEKEVIINSVRSKVKGQGKVDSRDNCWNYFIDKVKQNLHMSLCFSPVGESLRRRARQFPALVNSTVIDWFFPWPKDALLNVATRFLEKDDLGDDSIRKGVVTFMPYSFEIVNKLSQKLFEQQRRYVYTTPKSFLELIKLFKSMLQTKRDFLLKNKDRYESGLIKLQETAQQVAIIQEEVKVKQIQAEEKKQQADEFAEKVGIEKAKVQIENAKAEIEAEKCAVIKRDVEEKKSTTQTKLEAAGPLVKQAEEALNSISKKDFDTCKAFASPPGGIPEVFAATIWLLSGFFNEVDTDPKTKKPKAFDWKASTKMMKNPKAFMTVLLEFKEIVNAGDVPAANVAYVKKEYLSNPVFDPAIMVQKSNAAAGLCSWVINIVKFYDVIQQVGPLRKSLEEAKLQLQEATIKLNQVQEVVRNLNEKLAELNRNFQQAESAKQAAINEANRCARRLNLAQRLVKALGSENERWAGSIQTLNTQVKVIVGDVLLASAFVSYAGPFNKKFRDNMIQNEFIKYFKANNIPTSSNIDPVKLLIDESTAARWNKQNLPSDKVSIQNGTILTNSQRYPLMIDPQLQGITWIREKEKQNKLRSLRLGSKNINRELEVSIQNGFSVVIENMDEAVDAILMPVIARSFIKKGKNKILKFASKDLTLHNNFRLFLHTKLSNPHYPPEIQAEATLINFTVTEDGLGDQLLYLIVQRQRPDLAAKKIELITQQNDFKIKLKELEDELLYKLANAKGDFLDDIALIENLEYSKQISTEVAIKVQIAKTTQAKINQTSQNYRPAASRGALIYFLLSDLAKIHSFYKFSLQSFIVVINRAIDQITQGLQKGKPKMFPVNQKGEAIIPAQEKPRRASKRTSKMIQGEQKPEETKVEGQAKPAETKPQQIKPEAQPEGEDEIQQPMSPKSLKKRIDDLIDSISYCAFQYTRRGLFERHKLIVSTMLTLRIMLRRGQLKADEVEHLIIGKQDPNPPPLPQSLKNFITDNIWASCKGLQNIAAFAGLGASLQADILQWKKWYQQQRVQVAELPKAYKDLGKFHRLLLMRAMRPDRVTYALTLFVSQSMGERYVEQPPFNIYQTFDQTDKKTSIFFVLFPGVDPTPEVQRVAAKYGISITNGKFINISMGQGQQDPAKKALFNCAQKGHWIMLQNLHLMQTWLKGINGLQGFLEQTYLTSHPNFRVFLSSEPPPLPDMQIIPESILQSSIKVSNEAPQFLKANLRRAYAHFDQKFLQKCDKKPNEFKSCLFALCYFHSLVLGRKKFGSQGWSRVYNFNDGDLTICADVLYNYLTKYDVVPWEDLKYIFGEIMYGGHITDNWDRRTNATYLNVLMRPELMLPNFNLLYHLFKNPDPAKLDYEGYRKYIQEKLPAQVPQMFGMHPNAEIGYLTTMCETLFDTILSVQGGSGSAKGGKDDIVISTLTDLKSRTPPEHSLFDITSKIKEKTPAIVVCLQQVERMNLLLAEIKRTLEDLRLGLTGALNMTDAMENLQKSLQYNKVPSSWETVAYPSKKVLSMWFNQLLQRNNQLVQWSKDLVTPKSLCIAYLFNPMSFLTAIMQNTARSKMLPLDNMTLLTNVTLFKTSQEVPGAAENGAYIHGLWLEGAAWQLGAPGQEGYLIDQRQKQLHPKMPVINVVAVPLKQKRTVGQYECPVYYTSARGATYIFTANLNMQSDDSDPSKWILSGTCMLMSQD